MIGGRGIASRFGGLPSIVACALAMVLSGASEAAGQVVTPSPHGALPEDLACTACHTADAWTPLKTDLQFDHASTGFALVGRHQQASCASCHEQLVFADAAASQSDCASCHFDVHLGTPTRPCAACHTTDSFLMPAAGVVHPADFPLEGAHLQTSCESCHSDDLGGAFSPPDRECSSCHMSDYFTSDLVDHQALGFSTYCLECHSALSFRDTAFDHFTWSGGFELRGAHAGIECTECHSLTGGDVPVLPAGPQDCVTCHLPDYEGQHGGSGFPTDCLFCHRENTWDDAEFDHFATTGFELMGDHALLDCRYCHVSGSGEPLFFPAGPQDCATCHQADYQSEHGGSGYPTDCLQCHTLDTWSGASFDHLAVSGFDLIGNHGQLQCIACHVSGSSATLFSPSDPQDCVACHQADYNPQHSGSGFSTDCLQCHTLDTWSGASFDHLAVSGFDLIGNHGQLPCFSCHIGSTSATLFQPSDPQDCVACHQADYDAQHAGSGYSTNCLDCHTLDTWGGVAFDHLAVTGFELIPDHDQLACSSCHVGPSGGPTIFSPSGPQDCYACHQADYDREHTGTGFSTTCLDCHQPRTWSGATFNHPFPISSGPHSNRDCTDCHEVPQDFTQFTCTSACHHTQQRTNDQHQSVSGYAYESGSCLSCHPSGRR